MTASRGLINIFILAFIALILSLGYFLVFKRNTAKTSGQETALTTDYAGAKVPFSDLSIGCLSGQDCIPSIDSPTYETVAGADLWLEQSDVVFGVIHNGIVKAYPQRIMNWHEIVNDFYGEDKVIVTFCPLCGTAVSFLSEVNGKIADFGVSGKLYNSDLIMYDRNEGNYWQQASGEAIIGPAARRDEYLEMLSTTTTTWKQWKTEYPKTLVLSKETGFTRNYSLYPYGTYEENGILIFGVQNEDTENRLHPKDVVYGVLVNGKAKAYPNESLVVGTLRDTVNNTTLEITKKDSGEVTFINVSNGEQLISLRGFWFSWVAFHPDTDLYKK